MLNRIKKATQSKLCSLFSKLLANTIIFCFSTIVFGQQGAVQLGNKVLSKNSNYGWDVAANSNFIALGGPNASYMVRGKKLHKGGRVVLYSKLNQKWVIRQTLNNPTIEDYGYFGQKLAMSEKFLVVSAPGYSSTKTGDSFDREGIVYVYKLNKDKQIWQLKNKIKSPSPNYHGQFGEKIHLRGDTLAVFYEIGSAYKEIPNRQAISFYNLSQIKNKPNKTIKIEKEGVPMYSFSFDFQGHKLVIGQADKLLFYQIIKNEFFLTDSISLNSIFDYQGNIQDIELESNQLFVSFREYMYSFWGYKPISSDIKDGELVIRRTVESKNDSAPLRMIIPFDQNLFDKYQISETFFKNHAKPFESIKSRVKRKASGGKMLYYNISNEKMKLNQILKPTEYQTGFWFGSSLAVHKNNLLIGALGYPDKVSNYLSYRNKFSGAVYHFSKDRHGNWQEEEIYRSRHRKPWDKFGFSISHFKNKFIIGCRFCDQEIGTDDETGAGYIIKIE